MSRIRANTIVNGAGTGAPNFPRGAIISGISTINAEISVGTGTSISSPATNVLALGTDNVERLRITSDGKVGIGTANPTEFVYLKRSGDWKLHLQSGDSENVGVRLWSGRNYIIQTGPAVNDGIRIYDETSGSAGERLRITSGGEVQITNGNLKFSTAGTGIDFSVTADGSGTTTSELLDDYEEGEFTPGITGGNTNLSIDTSINNFKYIKIGKQVTIFGRLRISGLNGASGALRFGNLPFTVDNGGTDQSSYNALTVFTHGFSMITNATGAVFVELAPGNTSGTLFCVRDNDGWADLQTGNINFTPGAYLYVSGSYYANS